MRRWRTVVSEEVEDGVQLARAGAASCVVVACGMWLRGARLCVDVDRVSAKGRLSRSVAVGRCRAVEVECG